MIILCETMLEKLFTYKADMVRCGFYEFTDNNVVFNICQFENERIYYHGMLDVNDGLAF